ncbi:MAG: prepilin-type N-terminal cleavage/methylation domain-containing protein [Phycisphaerales bacterium]|nr:prepilin-type N-terminal cleavage/methylation domain-containing protein [Phycisphaerales bacterium]
MTSSVSQKTPTRGFTIVELLVVVSIIALLIALLLPAIQKGRDKALIMQSVSNLKNLATACETYAGDWADRQFTPCPDDYGLVGGNCGTYQGSVACPPQQLLGWDVSGAMWGYFTGNQGKCAAFGYPGNCGNFVVLTPMQFNPVDPYGAYRCPNTKAFHDYVNRRFYDPTFYAPKDVVPLANIEKYFQSAAEFTYDQTNYEDSSYCFSSAAMYDPRVFGSGLSTAITMGAPDYVNPNMPILPASYRSPSIARCKYPTLKTRMIEHNWLQNTPDSLINPGFTGGVTPWFFNHGYNSAPACMFFDGHIELVQCQRATQAEQRAGKLWSRLTPFGSNGYYGAQSYDFLVDTSFHILTRFGIEGRDVLGAEG